MKNVNDIRADILAAMQAAAEPESGDLNKSAEQVLADAIEGYLTASTATASKSAPKAKTIKEKGIALCHQAQGYSANLRPHTGWTAQPDPWNRPDRTDRIGWADHTGWTGCTGRAGHTSRRRSGRLPAWTV